jgi:hypothetical protein
MVRIWFMNDKWNGHYAHDSIWTCKRNYRIHIKIKHILEPLILICLKISQ